MKAPALLVAAAAVVSLTVAGCSMLPLPPPSTPSDAPHEGPPARTHWELRHRLLDTKGLRVVGQQLDAGGESSTVRLTDAATAVTQDCYVTLSVLGEGGPDHKVGQQLTTTYDGHPAVRGRLSGGAESDYLMWQLDDDSWVEVSCDGSDPETAIQRVAAAVDLEPTPILIPFDVELPADYRVAGIVVDLERPSGRVYVGRTGRQPWSPEAELDLAYGFPELSPDPPGEPTTLGGRPARVDDTKTRPAVWVQDQGRWLYVGITASDTGPYPNRRAELPAIRSIAESLSPATDLGDTATWLAADGVFG